MKFVNFVIYISSIYKKRICLGPKAWNIISHHAFSVFFTNKHKQNVLIYLLLFQDREVKHEECSRVYPPMQRI